MKALLICPSFRPAVPLLAVDGPLALTPILGECIVSHWIEHVVSLGARQVRVIAADRAGQVRAALGDGARWGVELEVIAAGAEPTRAEAAAHYQAAGGAGWLPAPHDIVVMNHLPGRAEHPLFESYASWFAALLAWMPLALTPARVRVSELVPGIWVGRRAHVSATAKLIAPCWIGDQVFVEPGATIGPGAILEDRSVVEKETLITLSWIGCDTFVGPMMSVSSSLAWGNTLTNWRTDSSLHVPDPFLLCSLSPATATADHAPARAKVSPPALAPWTAPPRRVSNSHPAN